MPRRSNLKEFKRNNYFHGKLLTHWDFMLEQSYFNNKRYLLNQLIFGYGIVTGLTVAAIEDGKGIAIAPGVAVDELGREIIVQSIVGFENIALIDGFPTGINEDKKENLYMYLEYTEEGNGEALSIADLDPCKEKATQKGHIREGYKISFRTANQIEGHNNESKKPANKSDVGVVLSVLGVVFKKDNGYSIAKVENYSGGLLGETVVPSQRPGWVRLPFYPNRYEDRPEFINKACGCITKDKAAGVMGIPIPAHAASLKSVRVDAKTQGEVVVSVFRLRFGDNDTFKEEIILKENLKSAPFKELNVSVDARLDTISILIEAEGQTEVYAVSAVFE